MSQITAELLQKLAPGTAKSKRDRFLPYLNEVCPRYDITTEYQVAAFLATCMVESDHFKTTKEYKAAANTKAGKAQAKYWPSGFYGRALIQLTHRDAYVAFQREVGRYSGIDVVAHPETLEEPRWAVEASCWYWKKNNLNKYADMGLKGFHSLEGVVNTGRPSGNAWGYPERLAAYELARRVMPDDFKLGDEPEIEEQPEETSEQESTPVEQPIEATPEIQEGSPAIEVNTESANIVSQPTPPAPQDEPITVKAVAVGIWTKVLSFIGVITGMGINFSTIVETKLENITLNQVMFCALGVGLLIMTIFYFKKRQEAADAHTRLSVMTAASTTQNTVIIQK